MGRMRWDAICAAGLLALAGAAGAETNMVTNGGFEDATPSMVSHFVPGWMNYGMPAADAGITTAERHDGAQALQMHRGLIFCYGIAIEPERDYVLSFWAKGADAHPRVEADPPGMGKLAVPGLNDAARFDWKRFEVSLPASKRPAGTREMWIALGAVAAGAAPGVVYFDDVRLQTAGLDKNLIPNPSFEERFSEVAQVPGWTTLIYAEHGGAFEGAAEVSLDRAVFHEGRTALRVAGRNTCATRITQIASLEPLRERGVKRVRVSAWGKCAGLGVARAQVELAGVRGGNVSVLTLTGDTDWMHGEALVDLERLEGRDLDIRLGTPHPTAGTFWMDDIRVEEADEGETVNLLRNSGFMRCSSDPRLPDLWGIWGNATWTIKNWTLENFGVDDQAKSPLPGARVLKMWYPPTDQVVPVPPGKDINYYMAHDLSAGLAPGNYTLSVYLKAARTNTLLRMTHPSLGTVAEWRLGETWKRYTCTGTNTALLCWFMLSEADSTVWLAAPQLETGTNATAYRPAPGEGQTPPPPAPELATRRSVVSLKTSTPPTIDGRLDDACWGPAQKLTGLVRMPDGQPAGQPTEAFVAHDASALYIGIRCVEPDPDKLRVREFRRDSRVFSDDSVEVFLSPTETAQPYYHFAVNAAGVQWDAMNLNQPDWDGDWKVATGRESGAWTAELAIRFTSFPAQALSSNWRLNICRSRFAGQAEPELSAWAPMADKGFHAPAYFGRLAGIAPEDLVAMAEKRPSVAASDSNLLGTLMGSGAPLEAYAEFDFYSGDPQARVKVRWAKPEAATIRARLLDTVTGKVINLALAEFDIPAASPTGWRRHLPWQGQRVTIAGAGEYEFVIPLKALPAGAYDIAVSAWVDGRESATARDRLVKLPPGSTEVRLSRFTRGMVVNGTPFFPIFLPQSPGGMGDWHLDQLKNAGFNCLAAPLGRLWQAEIVKSGVPPAMEAEIRAQLDRLQASGLKFLWPISWSYQDWPRTKEIFNGDAAAFSRVMARIVETFKDHPAIIGWYLLDEPSRDGYWEESGFHERDMQTLHAAVKAADPYRPTYVNWNHSWKTEPYGGLACTDIVCHDNYVTANEPFDWELLVPSVRMLNDRRSGRKPGFIWIAGSYNEIGITPGPDAVRVHAWLHLVYGSRGLGYWDKHPMNPAVWDVMQAINREALFLNSHAFGPATARMLAVAVHNERIHWALWENGNMLYLFGVNTAGKPVAMTLDVARFAGRAIGGGKRLFDVGALNLKNGVLKDEFPACGRRAYVFDLK